MTDEEKAARAEKARKAKAEAAKKRSEAIERAQLAEVRKVWDILPAEKKRIFNYIKERIKRSSDPADVAFLRETRRIHLQPFRHKEVEAQ